MAEALPQWPLQEHNCVTQKKKPALRLQRMVGKKRVNGEEKEKAYVPTGNTEI